ncbi:dihydropteroate synthase [Psychrobacillus psychrodurans]|uniref:dihydropteroate synthase n=1 Tax=Psychrobacillus psychrodurans TaxID=126157 RepID=UPI0008E444D5|nr:dihydropteroate synthase [Psychrobacillus psychrodurans]MCK1999510.1 dihydropteroate synthase [Psychrobacillus psychrodurans]MCZ8542098.1 dihydropteroate synthase [Psychrobacillus psychrodurans]SFN16537.1 dihydropteroate synthase [Psychrobacillus psychrodurans]
MNLHNNSGRFEAGGVTLNFDKETIVMGILNVTPDSFSDGGKFNEIEAAVTRAKQMVADGAKIIDVGGESTRPGYTPISDEEEIARVVPVIKAIRAEVNAVISIDTYKSAVAKAAIIAGAHVINDIWGAKRDPKIAKVAAEYGVPIILMHNRDNEEYTDFWSNAKQDLLESIQITKAAGVPDGHIWLDPGIGFAKSTTQNILMMQHLNELVDMGYPVLLATSRKRLIGNVLNLPVNERMEGTGATVCYGIQVGCHMVRVHDVKEMSRMTKMMDVLTGKVHYTESEA